MRRLILRGAVFSVLLVLGSAALAWASYQTTWQSTYGAFPPFELEITVVDAAGVPVPQPTLKLLDADTLEAADKPFFAIDPRAGITGDDQGRVALRFSGQPVEIESWRLFWLFPRIISGPRGLDSYLVAISAPGHTRVLVALPALLHAPSDMLPLPDDSTRQMFRYVARVTLP